MHITSLTSFSCWESGCSTGGRNIASGVIVVGGSVSLNKIIQVSTSHLPNPCREYEDSASSWTLEHLSSCLTMKIFKSFYMLFLYSLATEIVHPLQTGSQWKYSKQIKTKDCNSFHQVPVIIDKRSDVIF